jgi:NAD(P)H-dependent FMN reductase
MTASVVAPIAHSSQVPWLGLRYPPPGLLVKRNLGDTVPTVSIQSVTRLMQGLRFEEPCMESNRSLFIPVILGTARMGRMSVHAAQFVTRELGKCEGVQTELIDIAKLPLPTNDAGEAIKQAEFSANMSKADALVVVSPEYNHGYSGLLKHVLDSCLKEYIHKAVGIVGVSAGPFGGTRVIENLLPVMREIGMVTIFWDVNFSNVQKVFAEDGRLLDDSYIRRVDKFLKELIWMAKTLRQGRELISLN